MTEFSDAQLIFLLSQQRAGSTLLQRILGRHPHVHTTAEPWLMLHPLYALRPTGHQAEYSARLAYEAVQDFCATLPQGESHYRAAIRRLALDLYGTACLTAGKPRFLDKTPRYYFILPELLALFPAAKFIILLRNPLAVLASILQTRVKGYWILLRTYQNDLLTAPRRLVEAIETLGARAIVVHYEALVTSPEQAVSHICTRLELDYRPDMLQYGEQAPQVSRMGDKTGIQQHDRPSTASLTRWHRLAEAPQTRHFLTRYLDELGPELITRMGYDANDLAAQLSAVPGRRGKPAITWDELFAPELSRRQLYAELAMFEHRRLSFRFAEWLRRWRER